MTILYMRRPHAEHFNSTYDLQWHTEPTVGAMVCGAIACDKWSRLIFLNNTITAKTHIHNIFQPHVLPLMTRLWGAIFHQDNARLHTARVSQDCLCHITNPSLVCSITRFVPDWEYLRLLRPASWTACKSGWIKCKFRTTMEWNATDHYTWVVYLTACCTTSCI